jgi:hypothetical protein
MSARVLHVPARRPSNLGMESRASFHVRVVSSVGLVEGAVSPGREKHAVKAPHEHWSTTHHERRQGPRREPSPLRVGSHQEGDDPPSGPCTTQPLSVRCGSAVSSKKASSGTAAAPLIFPSFVKYFRFLLQRYQSDILSSAMFVPRCGTPALPHIVCCSYPGQVGTTL